MSEETLAEFDAGEADYFSAILRMQNASQQSSALPEPLLILIEAVTSAVQKEGVLCRWAKPVLIGASELAGFGAVQGKTVFHRHFDGAQQMIAFDHDGAVGFVNLLLSAKPVKTARAPSRAENQILQGFAGLLGADFKSVEPAESSIIWQDCVGAKLAFSDEHESPALILMINRRSDNTPVQHAHKPDIQQQNFMRQTVSNRVLNVDYVLDGGAVPLALLRNLLPGSVLPLTSLCDTPLEARGNGKAVFRGNLKLTADQMAMDVAHILTGGRVE